VSAEASASDAFHVASLLCCYFDHWFTLIKYVKGRANIVRTPILLFFFFDHK
jgi:hypothetical protein